MVPIVLLEPLVYRYLIISLYVILLFSLQINSMLVACAGYSKWHEVVFVDEDQFQLLPIPRWCRLFELSAPHCLCFLCLWASTFPKSQLSGCCQSCSAWFETNAKVP